MGQSLIGRLCRTNPVLLIPIRVKFFSGAGEAVFNNTQESAARFPFLQAERQDILIPQIFELLPFVEVPLFHGELSLFQVFAKHNEVATDRL